jgi:hypothetical protein
MGRKAVRALRSERSPKKADLQQIGQRVDKGDSRKEKGIAERLRPAVTRRLSPGEQTGNLWGLQTHMSFEERVGHARGESRSLVALLKDVIRSSFLTDQEARKQRERECKVDHWTALTCKDYIFERSPKSMFCYRFAGFFLRI